MSDTKVAIPAREVKTSVRESEDVVIVSDAVTERIGAAFDMQDDIENASKYQRAFLFDAVTAHLKVVCNKAVNDWTRLVDKYSKLHPALTRTACESELLASKRAAAIQKRAVQAAAIGKTL